MLIFLLSLEDEEVFVDEVFFDDEVVDDEILSGGGVLAHVELEEVVDGIGVFEGHGVETDAGSDELLELLPVDLTETFESGYLPL